MQLDRRFLDGSARSEQPVASQHGLWSLLDKVNGPTLRAGPVRMLFDQGGIRYIRLGDRELVRRVYCAVRDANWGTIRDQIPIVRTDIAWESFRVEFDVINQERDIDFAWRGIITGEENGRIVFEMNGVANSTFLKSRIGFCILHPMELAGTPVEIKYADGSWERTRFPKYIAAENPYQDVTGIRHAVEPGIDVELTFEGDLFETEDQRNWIDASFKTFCTPLSRPRPVEIRAGERVFQRVTIDLHYESEVVLQPLIKRGLGRYLSLELASQHAGPLPQIGFTLPADSLPLSPRQINRLRMLKPSHLRCDIRLAEQFAPNLQRAIHTAATLDTSLELALFIGAHPEQELAALVESIEPIRPSIARWTIFPAAGWSTTRDLARTAMKYLRQYDPQIPIGGGTPANFRELNGQRPPVELLDFITWSLTPQIHAFDNASLVETLAAHSATVDSAREFAGDLPLVVGPVTFKMQSNPYATGPWPPPTPTGQLPPQVDVRQLSLFAAGWTLGSIKYLAESGVQAATYYDLVGWKGLMEHDTGSPLPGHFPSIPGCVFPLYHVFADLAEMPGARVLPLKSSKPLVVDGLALTNGSYTRLLVANFTGSSQSFSLRTNAKRARFRSIAKRNLRSALTDPDAFRSQRDFKLQFWNGSLSVGLHAYAFTRIDLT